MCRKAKNPLRGPSWGRDKAEMTGTGGMAFGLFLHAYSLPRYPRLFYHSCIARDIAGSYDRSIKPAFSPYWGMSSTIHNRAGQAKRLKIGVIRAMGIKLFIQATQFCSQVNMEAPIHFSTPEKCCQSSTTPRGVQTPQSTK